MEQENQEFVSPEIQTGLRPETTRKPIKGWVRLLILILPYILIVGVFEVIGSYVAGYSFFDIPDVQSLRDLNILQLFNLAGTFVVLYLMMRFIDREPFINLGFHTKSRTPDILIGTLLGLGVMVCAFVLLQSIGYMIVEEVDFSVSDFILLVILFVLVAFAEEMLLRGYVLKNLMLSMNKYVALLVSALIFSVMHALNPNFSWITLISLFLAGIGLGATYIYTKNLWFPIAYHFSWNFFQSLVGFNVSGLDIYSVIVTEESGPDLLTGGAFGLEGSILGIIAEVLVIAGIITNFELKNRKSRTEEDNAIEMKQLNFVKSKNF